MSATVTVTGDVTVAPLLCPTTEVAGPQEMQARDSVVLCLVRAGCFQYRDSRGQAFLDPTTCLFAAPRQVGEMTHPAPGGDLDTLVLLCPEVLVDVGGGSDQVPLATRVTPAMHVRHRRLLAALRDGDRLQQEELALAIVAAALAQDQPARVAAGRPATRRARRALAEDARTVLATDPTLTGLPELARRLGCSPHHLSRVFHEHTGRTLSAYRTALRVHLAVELLADGEDSLADIAAQSGFADHAHLTRTLRRHAGTTPAALRAQLV